MPGKEKGWIRKEQVGRGRGENNVHREASMGCF
jgi:hypothetical protein